MELKIIGILAILTLIVMVWPKRGKKPETYHHPPDTAPRDCGTCDRLYGCILAGNDLAPCNMYRPKGCLEIGDERKVSVFLFGLGSISGKEG